MAVAKRHRHKYRKVEIAGVEVWGCALPDCNHYMPKHMENLVNGKHSTCWGCGADITLNPSNMQEKLPKCENCRMGIKPEEVALEDEAPIPDILAQFLNPSGTKS